MIGINRFVNITESWVAGILAADAAGRWPAALVDAVALDVARRVVAGEESRFVAVGVAGEGAANVRRAVVRHLREMSNVVALHLGRKKVRNIFFKCFQLSLHVPPTAIVDGRLVGERVLVEPHKHRTHHQASHVFESPRLAAPCEVLPSKLVLP